MTAPRASGNLGAPMIGQRPWFEFMALPVHQPRPTGKLLPDPAAYEVAEASAVPAFAYLQLVFLPRSKSEFRSLRNGVNGTNVRQSVRP